MSALINKYGCRPVGIAGSLLASFSFVICTLSRRIEAMVFLFGICGGKLHPENDIQCRAVYSLCNLINYPEMEARLNLQAQKPP